MRRAATHVGLVAAYPDPPAALLYMVKVRARVRVRVGVS
jgi:hypothetical protein